MTEQGERTPVDDPLAPVPDADALDGDDGPGPAARPSSAPPPPAAGVTAAVPGPAAAASDPVEAGGPEPGADRAGGPGTVEELIADLERTLRERDEFLEALRRTQADFENYRKRVMKQQTDGLVRAAEGLVEKLLPVLDACDGAVRHGAVEVEPVFASLLGTLEKEGLERIDPTGEPFDPNRHEAVMHEPASEGDETTVVSDVMRAGYAWKGRIVRPAMVKVRG